MLEKRGEELYLEIYIDVIFIINFIMDFILLSVVMKILKWKCSIKRRGLGSIIGASCACILAIIPELNHFLQFIISYILICIGMIFLTFKPKTWKMTLKGVFTLYVTTFFIGGLFNSLYYHSMLGYYFHELITGRFFSGLNGSRITFLIIGGITGIIIFVVLINNLRRRDVELYETEIFFQDKSVWAVGLLDTGNNLYDPIFKKPVNIIEQEVINKILSEEQRNYINMWLDNPKVDLNIHFNNPDNINVYMIPFSSIGKKKGLLPAIEVNKLEIIKGEEKIVIENVLTGIWNGQLSKNNEYQLILHRDLI